MSQAVASSLPNSLPASERFRPNQWGWYKVVLLGCCAWFFVMTVRGALFSPLPKGMSHTPPNLTIVILSYVICSWAVMTALLAVLLAAQLLISEVRVSEGYLSWRTWRGTQTVRWSDVLDYFETDQRSLRFHDSGPKQNFLFTRDTQDVFSCLVKTSYGDCLFSQRWPHARRLQEVIATHAVHARAKQWGLLGTRPELDLPTTFRYDNAMSRWGVALARCVLYIQMAWMSIDFFPATWQMARLMAPVVGWGEAIAPNLLILAFLFAVLGFSLSTMPGFSELRRRRAQSITLIETGILYTDGARTTEVKWREITRLTTDAMNQLASLETHQGPIDFRMHIRHYQLLKSAIEARTRETAPAGWQPKAKERLDQSLWQTTTVPSPEQARFFSYRTRTNRGLLVIGSIYFWGAALGLGWPLFKDLPDSLKMGVFADLVDGYVVIGSLWMLWSWRSFLAAGIRTDADGMTQLTTFGPRRISWSNVKSVKTIGAEAFTWVSLSDGKKRIWFTPFIADSKELLTEIKNHTQQEPELS